MAITGNEDFRYDRAFNLVVWTVYDRPSDFPDHIVIRGIAVMRDGSTIPRPGFLKADSIQEARSILMARGLNCIPRDSTDDARIVETWI